MFRKGIYTAIAAALIGLAPTASAYDSALAASYADLFAAVAGAKAGKELHLMMPNAFVEAVNSGKEIVALDIRTPAEAIIFTSILPNSLFIPIDQLFKPENLDTLPTDKPLVVLCKSGTRATAAGTALRHIGFDNVYILKGGFKALIGYLGPKTANALPTSASK